MPYIKSAAQDSKKVVKNIYWDSESKELVLNYQGDKGLVEVRFKPADVGTVADGAITDVKITSGGLSESKIANLTTDLEGKAPASHSHAEGDVTDLVTDLGNKVGGIGTSGDKKVNKLGWDSSTNEVIIDHE